MNFLFIVKPLVVAERSSIALCFVDLKSSVPRFNIESISFYIQLTGAFNDVKA